MNFAVTEQFKMNIKALATCDEPSALSIWKKKFWEMISEKQDGISSAIGIYVFNITHGSSITPWYVGKTVSKLGYKGEIFQKHKIDIYKKSTEKRGSASMLFVPLLTDSGKYSRNTTGGKYAIEHVEKQLIAMATLRNPYLWTVKDAKLAADIFVPGVIGKRRPRKARADAKLMRTIFFGKGA